MRHAVCIRVCVCVCVCFGARISASWILLRRRDRPRVAALRRGRVVVCGLPMLMNMMKMIRMMRMMRMMRVMRVMRMMRMM